LTGKYADGLGNVKNVPDRADFDPFPWHSMAVWILTQMKRWGYIKGEVDLPADRGEGVHGDRREKAHGRVGDEGAREELRQVQRSWQGVRPGQADAYLASFAIRKAA